MEFFRNLMNFLQNFYKNISTYLKKSSVVAKVLIGFGVIFLVVLVIFSFTYTSSVPGKYLFEDPLSKQDFRNVITVISKMNVEYQSKDGKYIIVKSKKIKDEIIVKLEEENKLPKQVKAWDLFDIEEWTTTDFQRSIKLRRAVVGSMIRTIRSLSWVEDATIDLNYPDKDLFTDRNKEITASVVIFPKIGYQKYLKNKKVIKGIEKLVGRGIDGLLPENIVISDNFGNILNDFIAEDDDREIKKTKQQKKIIDDEVKKITKKIEKALDIVLSPDRYRVMVDIEMNFNSKKINSEEIVPVTIKKGDPTLPYDNSVVKEGVPISVHEIKKEGVDQGYVPEGPPGQEPNTPEGYKELNDNSGFIKVSDKKINYGTGKRITEQVDDTVDIDKKSVSVMIDGEWKEDRDKDGNLVVEKGAIKREYSPYPLKDIKKIKSAILASINFNERRGDRVEVVSIQFDRQQQFQKEDQAYIKAKNRILYFKVILLVLSSLIFIYILYTLVKFLIIDKRNRKQMQDLSSAEDQEGFREELLSLEEEEQSEVSEKELNFQKLKNTVLKKPETVVKILRLWLKE